MKKLFLVAAVVLGAFVFAGSAQQAEAGYGCFYPSYGYYHVYRPVYPVYYHYPAYYGHGCYHW